MSATGSRGKRLFLIVGAGVAGLSLAYLLFEGRSAGDAGLLTLSNARYSVPILPHVLLLGAYGIRRVPGRHAGSVAPAA
jgi:glycine/D-amino acid oxidase-like deaminating enzyme